MTRRLLLPLLSLLALATLAGLALAPSAAHAPPVHTLPGPDGRAGMCYTFYDPGYPFLPLALAAGARWERFNFDWHRLEPSDGQWDDAVANSYEVLVNDLTAAGMDIVGMLLWTPDWAATGALVQPPTPPPGPPGPLVPPPPAEAQPSPSPPRGLYEEWNDWSASDDPGINYWGRFVYQAVSRYGDRVQHWEIWNEPDYPYFWSGTPADYAQLLRVGYLATQAACPDCTVLFGGLQYWGNPAFYTQVLDILNDDPQAAQYNYYFDVMSVHLYSRSSTIYDVVNAIRSGMVAHVPAHPIWLTETGVPVWDDASVDPTPYEQWDYTATQDEAAAFVLQSYANAWAAGVERYFFFRTHDADMDDDTFAPAFFGLIRNDRSPRPAYSAYRVATTYLVSPTMATSWTYADGTRRVTLWGTPRGKVSVLWNTTPTTLTFYYPAILPTATRVDRWGNAQTITAAGGSYALTLPAATANLLSNPGDYIIGGETYLVLEADTTPPTATVLPLPAAWYSPALPVSWTASDDAAGIWGSDVQVREGGGAWTDWLRFTQTQGITTAVYTNVQHGQTLCFRARAWDRAGNRGAWPADAQACTTIAQRTLHLTVAAVFGDGNENGLWDGDEVALTASFRFVDEAGTDVVPPTVGAGWAFTTTLWAGTYRLLVTPEGWPSPPPGWLPAGWPLAVAGGAEPLELNLTIGLPPHRHSLALPVAQRAAAIREDRMGR